MASKCISEFTRSLGLQVHLQTRSNPVCKSISQSTQSLHLQVHLQTRSIPVSNCISVFTLSQSPSASPNTLHQGLHQSIFKVRRQVYGDTGVTEVDRVMWSIYLADPRVHSHHLISISSYHKMKIPTLSFPTFSLTRSVRDFVDQRNCMNPQLRVVSYLLTRFLRSSNRNRSFS